LEYNFRLPPTKELITLTGINRSIKYMPHKKVMVKCYSNQDNEPQIYNELGNRKQKRVGIIK